MKQIKLLILIFSFGLLAHTSSGQDYLFSQFDMMPQIYNAAQTGDFYGTARIGGIYRDHGFAISKYRFRTPGFYIDSPIIRGFRSQDWIGIGAVLLQDNAGAGQLKTGEIRFNVAYHLGLDKRSKNTLSFGLQFGNYARSFGRAELLEFESDLTGTGTSTAQPITSAKNKWAFGAGALYIARIDQSSSFRLGFGVTHLYNFNYSVNQGSMRMHIPITFNAHAGYETKLSELISINPMLLAQYVGGQMNIAVQSYVSVKPDPQKEFYLEPGLGYRYGDAVMLFFGAKYDGFKVRLGYDATISRMLPANGTAGALELAASYIVRINKPPEVEKRIVCPRI